MSNCQICGIPRSGERYCTACLGKLAEMRKAAVALSPARRQAEVRSLAVGCGIATPDEILWATALTGREIGQVNDSDLYLSNYLQLMREAGGLSPSPQQVA